jgi:hypothetical protein
MIDEVLGIREGLWRQPPEFFLERLKRYGTPEARALSKTSSSARMIPHLKIEMWGTLL